MFTKNFKACLFGLFLCLGLSNQSYSQDGIWPGGIYPNDVPYYNPHANDNATYGGIQKVQVSSNGTYYALVRIDYSYDTSNGPDARRKRDHSIIGIPYAGWQPTGAHPALLSPYPTTSVPADDNIPSHLKYFGNNTTQYIWIPFTDQDATTLYFDGNLRHVFNVAMMYSNDWLGLFWYLTAYNVMIEDFFINDSFSKADVTY